MRTGSKQTVEGLALESTKVEKGMPSDDALREGRRAMVDWTATAVDERRLGERDALQLLLGLPKITCGDHRRESWTRGGGVIVPFAPG
jgi:hypothetical protein